MKILWRDLDGLGFKHSNMFEPKPRDEGTFFKTLGNVVLFVYQGKGGVFRLSPEDIKKFRANKLSLTPPGCCNPSGRETREFSEGRDSYGISKEDFMVQARRKEKFVRTEKNETPSARLVAV